MPLQERLLKELFSANGLRNLRGDEPKFWVSSLDGLPWSIVIRAAPIGSALCATMHWSQPFQRAFGRWLDEEAVLTQKNFSLFIRALELAGVDPENVPADLMNSLSWGTVVGDKWSARVGHEAQDIGKYRLSSVIIPTRAVAEVAEYWALQEKCFGSHAYIKASEGEEQRAGDEELRRSFRSFPVFAHLPRRGIEPEARASGLACLMREMEDIAACLEAGGNWRPELFYMDGVNPPAYFVIANAGAGLTDSLEMNVFHLRAKIVRLLNWPQFLAPIEFGLDMLNGVFASAVSKSASSVVKDIPIQLGAYLSTVRKKFPVLDQKIKI